MTLSAPAPGLRCYTPKDERVILEGKIGSGGEGDIFEVQGQPSWAAKVYTPPNRTPEREAKLSYMAQHPPHDPFGGKHITFAWPLELLYDEARRFIGFVMPRLETHTALLFQIYHPAEAKKRGLTWQFRMAVAHNLAVVLEELHARGYVVGDLNESNFLVGKNGLVTLVDCDSIQVKTERGKVFHCRVQKPEYTPPELQGTPYSAVTLQPQHDNFALAVLIFSLLMEGRHPFAGRGIQTPDEGIRSGKSVLTGSEPIVGTPHPGILPLSLGRLFLRAFARGYPPKRRPSAAQWKTALEAEFYKLRPCWRVSIHWHSPHLRNCPWCDPGKVNTQLSRRSQRFLGELRYGTDLFVRAWPTALLVGIFLGLFRWALWLGLGLSQPIGFYELSRHPALWTFKTLLGRNLQLDLVLFYGASFALIFAGWLALKRPSWRIPWLVLSTFIALPYFAMPQFLSWLGTPYPAGLFSWVLAGLNVLLLLAGQIALFITALPAFALVVGLESLSASLRSLGLVAPLAWGLWGVGLGWLLGATKPFGEGPWSVGNLLIGLYVLVFAVAFVLSR